MTTQTELFPTDVLDEVLAQLEKLWLDNRNPTEIEVSPDQWARIRMHPDFRRMQPNSGSGFYLYGVPVKFDATRHSYIKVWGE